MPVGICARFLTKWKCLCYVYVAGWGVYALPYDVVFPAPTHILSLASATHCAHSSLHKVLFDGHSVLFDCRGCG